MTRAMDEKTTIMEPAPSTAAPAAAAKAADEDKPIVLLHAISRRFRQGDSMLDILNDFDGALYVPDPHAERKRVGAW